MLLLRRLISEQRYTGGTITGYDVAIYLPAVQLRVMTWRTAGDSVYQSAWWRVAARGSAWCVRNNRHARVLNFYNNSRLLFSDTNKYDQPCVLLDQIR